MSTVSEDVREVPGLTVRDGPHGRSLCTTKDFSKGQTLLSETRSQVFGQEFQTVDAFEAALRGSCDDGGDGEHHTASCLLQHSVPSISGRLITMSMSSPFSYLNHSDEPNVAPPYHHSDIDRQDRDPQDVFSIVALRDIKSGEYLTFDYNLCAGYDLRKDSPMTRFLELCAQFGEEKRPSQFR